MLQTLMAELREFQLAARCTSGQGQALNAKLGWEVWRGPLFIRHADRLVPTPGETVMIHRLAKSPAIDLDSRLSTEWRLGELW